MKTLKTSRYLSGLATILFATANCLLPTFSLSQCLPMIKIDGNNIIADDNLKLPAWLRETQTLAIGQYVYSISVIEFTVNGTALDYSMNRSVTTVLPVPAGKVWKIEAIHKDVVIPAFGGTITYDIPGAPTLTSPPCSLMARIQVWGGGGGGGGNDRNDCAWCGTCGTGRGGGGSGYAEGYYLLPPSTVYTVTVGAGGAGGGACAGGAAGGPSSFGSLISATGGGGGTHNGAVGAGGTGSGQISLTGQPGSTNGAGGNAPNGGSSSGGSGGGPPTPGAPVAGSAGNAGKVVITFGASGGSGSSTTTLTPEVPCVTMTIFGTYNASAGIYTIPACPSGWTDVGQQWGPPGFAWGNQYFTAYRTCYRCD